MPGLHNLSNATAALAACRMEGIPFEQLVKDSGFETPAAALIGGAPGKGATSSTTTPTTPVK